MGFVFPDEPRDLPVALEMGPLLLRGRLQTVAVSLLQPKQRVTRCSPHVLVWVGVSWLKMEQNVC